MWWPFKPFKPEPDLISGILRVREKANQQRVGMTILDYTLGWGAIAVLALMIGLAVTKKIEVPGMIAMALVAIVQISAHQIKDFRAQAARADKAFNGLIWPARLLYVSRTEGGRELDPASREEIERLAFQAIEVLNTVDAAAAFETVFGKPPPKPN